jgi:hypothetical protein
MLIFDFVQKFNVVTTFEFFICCKKLNRFFTSFKYLQIMRKLFSNLLSYPLILLTKPGTILTVRSEITCIKKV